MNHQQKLKKYGIELDDQGRLKCTKCGNFYHHLSVHLATTHNIKAKKYKKMIGFPHTVSLISQQTLENKRQAVKDKPTYKENFKGSYKYEFKEGEDRVKAPRRVPKRLGKALKERIENFKDDMEGTCPVCDSEQDHLPNHLFITHNLVQVIKSDNNK